MSRSMRTPRQRWRMRSTGSLGSQRRTPERVLAMSDPLSRVGWGRSQKPSLRQGKVDVVIDEDGLVGLDIETTGLDPHKHRVLAAALAATDGTRVLVFEDEVHLLREL